MLQVILLRFSQNDKLWFHGLDRHLPGHFFGHFSEGLSLWRRRVANHDRYSPVSTLADFDPHRNRSEKRHSVFLRQLFAAAFSKYVVANSGVRRDEVTHVLDH